MHHVRRPLTLLLALLLAGCATSPLGRSQLKLFPESEMATMGATAFRKVKQETPVDSDPAVNRYVRCVADRITAELGGGAPRHWEVTVFRDKEANAFALPGGKIGVNTGILKIARNQSQLATVIGHEVAHVVAGHPNERVSTQFATQAALDVLQTVGGGASQGRQQLFALLGLGANVGILLPFSRRQESEADAVGLDLMARAGFDPREALPFWRNMERSGGSAPPEFLSTHPSDPHRVAALEARMPQAFRLYQDAWRRGRRPDCH